MRLQIDAETVLRPKPLTLRFTRWECGHHQQRPADITCSSVAQANEIVHAISHAISQPGSANAVLMTDTHAVNIYITDDHVSSIEYGKGFPEDFQEIPFNERPILIYGTEAEIEEIHSAKFQDAVESVYGWTPARWDGKCYMEDCLGSTTLTLEQLQAIVAPSNSWGEAKPHYFERPPILVPAAEALAALQAEVDQAKAESEDSTVQTPALDTAEGGVA